jgi:predicted enzyme related to lactoylglutathione lyase
MSTEFNPVGWFEIPVVDMARAKTFYEHILGIQLDLHAFGPLQMAWFPMRNGEYGAAGSLVKHEAYTPAPSGTLVYFTVPDIDAALQRVSAQGGKVLRSKTRIGEYGFVGHFEDCEGNRVALHSRSG